MSLNVRTPPSTTYSTPSTTTPSQNPTQLASLAVALQTLKTALSKGGAVAAQAPATGAPPGASSFAPTAGARGVSGPQGASAAGGVDPSLAGTPMGRAQGVLGQEQQRLQQEKYNFPAKLTQGVDKFNEKQTGKNAKVEEKLAKLDAKIAAAGSDPKKLEKLQKERSKVAGELKPPVDAAKVTSEIDGVMNDPNIAQKDKKGKLEEIRNKYGLPKNGGPLSMDDLTKHLSRKTNDSKNRVGDLQKSELKQVDGEIKEAKKTFGKDSPQVKSLEAQKKSVDGTFKQTKDGLKSQADFLHKAYHKPSFFERVGNFFKGIGNAIAAPFKAVGNVVKGIATGVGKLFQGDIGGAFKSAVGGVKAGLGNIVEGAKSTVSNLGNLVSIAAPGLGEKINGFTTGLVDGVGNLAKGALDTVTSIPQGIANGAGKLLKGDIGGAFGAVAEGVKNQVKTGFKTLNDGLPLIATAASFVPGLQPLAVPLAIASSVKGAVEAGQRGDGFGVVASLAGGVAGGAGAIAKGASAAASTAATVAKGAELVQSGAHTAQALSNGDFLGAAGAAAGGVAKGASAASASQNSLAGSLPAGSAAQAQAQAAAARWNNVTTGANLVGSGVSATQSLLNGNYLNAGMTAADGVSSALSAYGNRPGASAPAPVPLQTIPTRV